MLKLFPHLMGNWISQLEDLKKWNPPYALVLDGNQNEINKLKQACPNIKIIYRFYKEDNDYNNSIRNNPEGFAELVHSEIMDKNLSNVDYFVTNNEVLQDWEGLEYLKRYTMRWMQLADRDKRYKCGIFTFSVGNPFINEKPNDSAGYNGKLLAIQKILPELKYAQDNGHFLSAHVYGYPSIWTDKEWLVGRWEYQFYPYFDELGLNKLNTIYTEVGLDKLIIQTKGGWRDITTAQNYANQLIEWNTFANKYSNVIGGCIFAVCGNICNGWESYNIGDSEVIKIIAEWASKQSTTSPLIPQSSIPDISEPLPTNPTPKIEWDERLIKRGIELLPVKVNKGVEYWKLIKGEYLLEKEHVFVNTLDKNGNPIAGVDVKFYYDSGFDIVATKDITNDPYALGMVNFPMYRPSKSYGVGLDTGIPSDKVWGMGLGTWEQPDWNHHLSYRFTYQLTNYEGEDDIVLPAPETPNIYLPYIPNANEVGKKAYVTAEKLNVREEPNANAKIVARIVKDNYLFVSENVGEWAKVGNAAWVHNGWLRYEEAISTVPTSKPTDSNSISIGQFKELMAQILNINIKLVNAVLKAESGNRTWNELGKPYIRVELHLLERYMNKDTFNKYFKYSNPRWTDHQWRKSETSAWMDAHTDQRSEYELLEFASQFNREGAHRSTSFGIGQILGINAQLVGYNTAIEMRHAFEISEFNQIAAFFRYIVRTDGWDALQKNDIKRFIASFNGTGQIDYYYKIITGYMNE